MLRPFVLAVVAAAILGPLASCSSQAADMAGQSRIGALFADPVKKSRRAVVREEKPIEDPVIGYAPEMATPAIVHGYYGKPNSYYYHSYYGTKTSLLDIRAPYGCGFFGYC